MKTSTCFEFKGFIPSAISLSSNIFDIKSWIAKVLFVSVSSESFSSGYFNRDILSFLIWPCGLWLLVKVSLNFEYVWLGESPYDSKLFFLMPATSWIPCSCILRCYKSWNRVTILFRLWIDRIKKNVTWCANGHESLFGTWYRKIHDTFWHRIVFPEIINSYFRG